MVKVSQELLATYKFDIGESKQLARQKRNVVVIVER